MLSGFVGMVGFHTWVAVLVVEPLNGNERRVRSGRQGSRSTEDADDE